MKTKILTLTAVASVLLLGSMNLAAQPHPRPEAPPHMKALERLVYPPDLVLRNQQEIDLTDAQRKSIRDLSLETQSTVAEIQWDMQETLQLMMELLADNSSSSEAVLTQLETVLKLENEVKITHMRLVLSIRDLLTPEQRTQLDSLRPLP